MQITRKFGAGERARISGARGGVSTFYSCALNVLRIGADLCHEMNLLQIGMGKLYINILMS